MVGVLYGVCKGTKSIYIDKQGNFKVCFSVSNDSCPYRTASFYEDSPTIEEKVLRFIANYNDDVVLTEGCIGNVADTLAYMSDISELEKPLSEENFDINLFMECFKLFYGHGSDQYVLEYVNNDVVAYFNFKYYTWNNDCSKNCKRGYAYVSKIYSRLASNMKAKVKLVNVRDIEGVVD